MTKKELQALMPLIGAINSAASEIDYYSIDYDCKSLDSIADKLRGTLAKFRKEAKI